MVLACHPEATEPRDYTRRTHGYLLGPEEDLPEVYRVLTESYSAPNSAYSVDEGNGVSQTHTHVAIHCCKRHQYIQNLHVE